MISILVLPLAIPYLPYNRHGWLLETSPVFCTIWGMLWYVSVVLTIFLVAVLSITRTIKIVCPFNILKKKVVMGVILGYLVVLIIQSTIPMWVNEVYKYDLFMSNICVWRNDILEGAAYHAYTQIIYFQTYFPIVLIIVSCILTIRSLRSSENTALNQANREVSITITLFTLICMVCNFPQVVMHLITIIIPNFKSSETVQHLTGWDKPYHYWFKFYMTLLVPINSALNPILYLWRMKKMRKSTRNMIKRCVKVANQTIGSPLSAVRKTSDTAVNEG